MKINKSVSNNINGTAHVHPCVLHVDVKHGLPLFLCRSFQLTIRSPPSCSVVTVCLCGKITSNRCLKLLTKSHNLSSKSCGIFLKLIPLVLRSCLAECFREPSTLYARPPHFPPPDLAKQTNSDPDWSTQLMQIKTYNTATRCTYLTP